MTDREQSFICEGISSLAEFRAVIHELDAIDRGSHAFRYPVDIQGQGSIQTHFTFSVLAFAKQLDTVLDHLNATADGLAATWDMHTEELAAERDFFGGDDFESPVQ